MTATAPDIRAFFDGYINAYKALIPIDQNAIAWPNRNFKPKQGQIYIKPDLIPADETAATLGRKGLNVLIGIYQVSVFAPAGDGIGPAEDVIRALLELFPTGARFDMGCLDMLVTSSFQGPAIQDDGRLMIPITVRYNAYTKRSGKPAN